MSVSIADLVGLVDITNAVELSLAGSCTISSGLKQPLYDPKGNSLNPCFVGALVFLFNVIFGGFAIFQLISILINNKFGPFPIKYSFGSPFKVKSVGIFQLVKLNSVFLQAILSIFLFAFVFTSWNSVISLAVIASVIINSFILLPLHIIEPTRSIIPSASLLLYWTIFIILYIVVIISDSFSPYKVFLPLNDATSSVIVYTIEIGLLINSIIILGFEIFLYVPSKELSEYFELNDWEPSSSRSIYSEFGFFWLNHLIESIYRSGELDQKDLPALPIGIKSDVSYNIFYNQWTSTETKAQVKLQKKLSKISNPTKKDKKLSLNLFWILIKIHWVELSVAYILDMSEMLFGFGQTFLFQRFILFFNNASTSEDDSRKERPPLIVGFTIATAIFICAASRFVSFNRYFAVYFSVRSKLQGSLTSMIYKKSLRLSPESRKGKTSGEIVNNLAVDVSTVVDLPSFVELSTIPVRLILTLMALYKIVGISTGSGFIVACILVPISTKVSTSISTLYNESMTVRDERTRLTSEIMNSVKSIKLYSWETPMLERLFNLRNQKELVLGKRIGVFNSFANFFWYCIPFLITCASLVTFANIAGIPLVPSIVFPAITLFNMLAEPILLLPNLFTHYVETKVSVNRLQDLFLLEELENTEVERSLSNLKTGENAIEINNATFVWNINDEKKSDTSRPPAEEEVESDGIDNIALSIKDFTAKKGDLTCIVGRVGTGKTTLLRSLLGEVTAIKGDNSTIKVNGTVAYCSQSPWIMNATVKENILFGCRFDKAFYTKTVEACQLLPDFDVLPDGDRTVVGEKGISLSGGQKARIALARAVYARADIYLLDDVLSAVDAHVGKKITDQVLSSTGILASKTLILATNAVSVLHKAHEIVLLKDKTITEKGNFEEVTARNGDLAKLIEEFGKKEEEHEKEEEEAIEETKIASAEVSETNSSSSLREEDVIKYDPVNVPEVAAAVALTVEGEYEALERIESRNTLRRGSFVSFDHNYEDDEDPDIIKKTGHTVEGAAKGEVKLTVYLEYFKACNYWYLSIYIICLAANVSASILGNYVLKTWSEKNLEVGHNVEPVFYLVVYSTLGISSGLFILFAYFIIYTYCTIKASKYFHDTMATAVLRSPMSFFETTPVGRILNRFADDINVIDGQIMWVFLLLFDFLFNAIGLLGVIIYNLPIMFFVVVALMIFYNSIRKYFIPSSRELRRLSSANKSPVFSHLQESVTGIETIRAYGQIDRFIFRNTNNVDKLLQTTFNNLVCNRWLSMRLQSISAIIVFGTTLMILSTLGTDRELSAALVGFVMLNALSVTGVLNAIIRMWADIETKSVSLERVIEFINLKPEAETIIENNRPAESWPTDGAISFKQYSTKYRENLDPVLKDLSIDIKPSEKVGIVGRTGAGKSTIAISLFRIIEASGGHIEIDGIDTSKIGLFDLRQKLNIIPQDAQTIEGSIRQNLDPFDQYTDEELWKVLELAHLKEHVEQMKTKKGAKGDGEEKKSDEQEEGQGEGEDAKVEYEIGLSARVFESGSNLSSGQRQLLSLARALLNKSKILILDEATAAVDVQTDKIIQETIRSEFKDKTILTIAHRLETILDSDRVLVLDKGQVKEFDTPKKLLSDTNSEFYSLCKQGGYLKNLDIDKL
ncbi:uncharacterized protein RJT21DRAFT_107434 [Scheffersomyces amazonensis]|uniref:uncharacterized protein n=1 Tax=Scheffersomyces amazonensis TaxID=1078765 RepID=UPI00315C91FD